MLHEDAIERYDSFIGVLNLYSLSMVKIMLD